MIDENYIKELLHTMEFKLQNGTANIYEKVYYFSETERYVLKVDFDKKEILYNEDNQGIKVHHKSASQFSRKDRAEVFVVLECIDRLLTIGYRPNDIELEKSWPSGDNTSGRLDILIRKNQTPYMMIECKTYGEKYEKAKKDTLTANANGESKGQLFNYYAEEKETEIISLYASELINGEIKRQYAMIPVEEKWRTLPNKKELFQSWNKEFQEKGIFEEGIKPYQAIEKVKTRGKLEILTNETSSAIFNQFLEILRHNAVSDKPNAFNKVLNLFICKIMDEDKNENEELQFVWDSQSDSLTILSNLLDLYKKGMKKFLNIDITGSSKEDLDKDFAALDDRIREDFWSWSQKNRLYTNSEFAFKDTYNEEAFEDNAKVLKEIVNLLGKYQFRYGHKQQFLGNFFEQLLNTSIKQESGQFFTPVPIARFMISSLPLEEVIDKNLKENAREILPVVVDYACGSGHFITEYMDIVQDIVNNYDTSNLSPTDRNKIIRWKQSGDNTQAQGDFEWAARCVYGIEKDYRLVKTAKVSTFLNGDGDSNIICADGLDKFQSSKYIGHLHSNTSSNNNFNVVVANPPYSVSSFRQTLTAEKEDFELYDYLTANSSEIECLFVERTAQLLKDGGLGAIILPSSVLSNTGSIYEKTREIILKSFHIRAIANMGPNTFMATGSNTIILFLERRVDGDYKRICKLVTQFFQNFLDFSYDNTSKVVQRYIDQAFENVTFEDYISFLKQKPGESFASSDYYLELKKAFYQSKVYKDIQKKKVSKDYTEEDRKKELHVLFYKTVSENEKNKLISFLLTFKKTTIVVKTGEKQGEKAFLGYEFSNRRGQEGIHYSTNENGNISSALYDDENLYENKNKVNYYIRKAFSDEILEIPESLQSNVRYMKTSRLLPLDSAVFSNVISVAPTNRIVVEGSYPLEFLKNMCYLQKGTSISSKDIEEGSIPVVAGGRAPAYYNNSSNRDGNIITVSASGASAGYVGYWDTPIFASDCTTIKSKDEEKILTAYVYYVLKDNQDAVYTLQKGQGQPHVYPDDLGMIRIPLPSVEKQKSIIDQYRKIDEAADSKRKIIEKKQSDIHRIIQNVYGSAPQVKMETLGEISRGASPRPIKKYLTAAANGVNWIKIGDISPEDRYVKKTREKITEEGAKKSVRVYKGDFILSNSMSYGRPYIVDIEGCIHDGWLLIRNLKDNILRDYLYYVLLSPAVQSQFAEKAGAGTTVSNLNISRVKSVKIPLPEISEQQKILKEIYSYTEEIDKLKEEIEDLKKQRKQILKQYL